MNKYANLSDFEINKKVALHVGGFALSLTVVDDEYKTEGNRGNFDPCNNPADAMPIIIENGIGIIPFLTSTPIAFDSSEGIAIGATAENSNVCRAAMEVFLMMKDEESNNDRI